MNILTDLGIKDNFYTIPYDVIMYCKKCGLLRETRDNKLRNSRIKQITCTLYMFNTVVLNNEVNEEIKEEINKLFFEGIIKQKEYYNNNELLKSVYEYFGSIIEKYYDIN